jgi:hypothetical protein
MRRLTPRDVGREELARLHGVRSRTTAEVARTLLEHLSRSAELIDQALVHTAAGVAPQEVATWSRDRR